MIFFGGVRPGSRFFAWRVPKCSTFVVEEKDPKPFSPRSATFNRVDGGIGGVAQLARTVLSFVKGLRQGPHLDLSVSPVGRSEGNRLTRQRIVPRG